MPSEESFIHHSLISSSVTIRLHSTKSNTTFYNYLFQIPIIQNKKQPNIMNSFTALLALAVVASASAGGVLVGAPSVDYYARPAYSTSYSVADPVTGDKKSAAEVRDGDVTKGSYSVVQPDGVLRTVNYIVTPLGGFQAQVLNNGIQVSPPSAGVVAVAAPAVAVSAPVAVAAAGPVVGVRGQNVVVAAPARDAAVEIAAAAHLTEHDRQTNNHLVQLAAANSRVVVAPAGILAANQLGWGSGLGLGQQILG